MQQSEGSAPQHLMPRQGEPYLVERLKAGDREAFDCIYRLYARRLYSFAYLVCRSHHDAEDILQDTFVKLWVHRERISRADSIKSLLFTIARNRLINAYKKLAPLTLTDDMTAHEAAVDTRSVATPGRGLEYTEFERGVMACIDDLPPTQRQVVMLSRFESLSNNEIADRLGLSLQTVKNALSMGLKTLRDRLARRAALGITLFLSFFGTF